MKRKRARPKHAMHLLPHEYGAACAWFAGLPVPDADYQKRLVDQLHLGECIEVKTVPTKETA